MLAARSSGRRAMQVEFQCKKCDDSFSLDHADLSLEPDLRCPGCGARAPEEQVENLLAALEEVFAAMAPLRRKFGTSLEIDSEELPPPYDEAPTPEHKAPLLDEEEEESEDLDEDSEEEQEADEI
jgi:DNA-directed RNA polymerase subunit RPC12/RpoP